MQPFRQSLVVVCVAIVVSGCAGDIPYRNKGFDKIADTDCQQIYNKYADDKDIDPADAVSPCWQRSREERDSSYDLLFVEFDDQGWIENSSQLQRPHSDFLDSLFDQLEDLHTFYAARGLSLVVFVHGWHHSAKANDENVRAFRRVLGDLASVEGGKDGGKAGRRVIGIYVGWRGDSLTIPYVNGVTFWDRKNSAEKVAQGSSREFFSRLDTFRERADRQKAKGEAGRVRMLTIGHSFGGLITFKSVSGAFLEAAVRYNVDRDFSRMGDLVVIVNPAFEGSRYEPLKIAGQRLKNVSSKQLPVVIVATSEADWATGVAFPIARTINTIFESTPGDESKANTRTVGHNDRYTTHKLSRCVASDMECRKPCDGSGDLMATDNSDARRAHIGKERKQMIKQADAGFKTTFEYLCHGLKLEATDQWYPPGNPFWVVETTGDIMNGHNDIFNPNMESFIRQMYQAVVAPANKSAIQSKP